MVYICLRGEVTKNAPLFICLCLYALGFNSNSFKIYQSLHCKFPKPFRLILKMANQNNNCSKICTTEKPISKRSPHFSLPPSSIPPSSFPLTSSQRASSSSIGQKAADACHGHMCTSQNKNAATLSSLEATPWPSDIVPAVFLLKLCQIIVVPWV